MKAVKTKVPVQVTLATELHAIVIEKEALEKREEAIREKLLSNLKAQGVDFVRLENGYSFTRAHRETIKPVFGKEPQATKWAEENNCLKLDTAKASKILKRQFHLPEFFERVIGAEYLTVKTPKTVDED